MVNGWDWVEEGQRIKERARAVAGLTEEIRSESIVFEGPLDFLEYRTELERLRIENLKLRAELVRMREIQPKTVKALHESLIHLGERV